MTTNHSATAAAGAGGPPRAKVQLLPSGYELHYHDFGHGTGYDTGGAPGASTVVLLQGSGPGANGWSNFRHNIGPQRDTE
jgi:hypothetical protein